MRPRLSLATQILALQVLIVLVTVAVSAAVAVQSTRSQTTRSEQARVLAIASSVAALPQVRDAYDDADPTRVLQPLAESVRRANGLTFVVLADRDQVRLAHPDPALVGQRLSTDAGDALSGRRVVATERGTLGRTVRAKVPVRDAAGEVVGVVSVGTLSEQVAEQWRDALPRLALTLLLALAVGSLGSWLLARRLERQTFGLEPREIGRLLEQREATLHGVREGLLVVDGSGEITLLNDEAVRLLGVPPDSAGRSVDALDLPPRLRDVLSGGTGGEDEIVLRAGRVLVLNRRQVDGVGAVVTLRDRTELDELTRELGGARSVTDALRAQAHEFSNRMHTVAGLLELGEHDEALSFIERVSAVREELSARLTEQVREPAVAAVLLAKTAYAAEHGVELRLAPDAALPPGTGVDAEALVTVVGNLVDNAVEALGGEEGWVEVHLASTGEGVRVEVRDSGPGLAPGLADEVFRHGFTTKIAESAGPRGLGLALTRQACVTRGGWVDVRNEGGAVFTALLPPDRVRVPVTTAAASIGVLVVDDDFMVARIHRGYVDRLPGFHVVGEAHTAAEALSAVERLRPDLVLLDVYLPDLSGLEVLRRLRADTGVAPDVVVVTAARDVETVRAAMHGGVANYLVKPFTLATFTDRLQRYAEGRRSLASSHGRGGELEQADVDRAFDLARRSGPAPLPKGLSTTTCDLVVEALRTAGTDLSAVETAERIGVSRVSARRYLEHLARTGQVTLRPRYGSAGRPEHRYAWTG